MELIARPRVRTATIAAAALLLAPVVTTSAPNAGTTHTPALRPVATTLTLRQREDHFAERVLVLVNRRRQHHHLRAVHLNSCVYGFSEDWARNLARRNAFEHSNLDRLLSRCDAPYASENIARIPAGITPRALVRLWMRSPEHRHNILSKRPTATGVGVRWDADEGVWLAVQNFARKPGSYPH